MNIGCAQHSSSKLDSALACTIFPRETRERPFGLFSIYHIIFYMYKRHGLPQISLIYADKKTGWINESAKADATENAEKDS